MPAPQTLFKGRSSHTGSRCRRHFYCNQHLLLLVLLLLALQLLRLLPLPIAPASPSDDGKHARNTCGSDGANSGEREKACRQESHTHSRGHADHHICIAGDIKTMVIRRFDANISGGSSSRTRSRSRSR